MTPEIEASLNRIGWEVVKRASPMMASIWAHELDREHFAKTDTETRRAAKSVELAFQTVFKAQKLLKMFPENIARNINIASVTPERMQQMLREGQVDVPDTLSDVCQALWLVMAGLEATLSRVEHEGGPKRRGNPKNIRPHKVAEIVANIFLVGMGEMPTFGKNAEDGVINGLFGQVVGEIFDLIPLGVGEEVPCRAAIDRLKMLSHEDWFALMAVRCPVTRNMTSLKSVRVF